MLIIRSSMSIEDLRDAIANECIDCEDVDRDSFWEGAKFALDQLGVSFEDFTRYTYASMQRAFEDTTED